MSTCATESKRPWPALLIQTSTRLKWCSVSAEYTVDIFRVPHIAREGDGTFRITDAGAGGFGTCRIAREQDDACAGLGKFFCNRLANAHRGAGHNDYLSVEFHARVCILCGIGKSR